MVRTSKGSAREFLDAIVWISPDKVSSLGLNPAWVRGSGCCLHGRRAWNFLKKTRSWQQWRLPGSKIDKGGEASWTWACGSQGSQCPKSGAILTDCCSSNKKGALRPGFEQGSPTSSYALCLVAQLWPTLCNPVDCSPPGSSVHGDSPGKNTGVGCYALLQGFTEEWRKQ